nr:immunoglobulin heavy chain junction region [Macaca mulatta]
CVRHEIGGVALEHW